jgi:hypothetical protein
MHLIPGFDPGVRSLAHTRAWQLFDALRVVGSYEYGFEIGAARPRYGDSIEIELFTLRHCESRI